MQVRLEVVHGAKTKEIILRLPSVIGRGGDAKVKLPASTVSRHHCEVYEYDGQIAVRDLASSNGTIVNGHKIKGPTLLTPEDELTIGPLTARLHPHQVIVPEPEPEIPTAPAVNPVVAASANPAEEVVPSFEELPVEEVQPIEAAESGSGSVLETIAIPDDDDSVLEYTEPKESAGRSFVGIAAADEPLETVTDTPVFDNMEETEDQVRADDTSLNDFFKKLDG